ncbi:MAG TPA: hypothetical protein VIY69_14890 [Candidatus Acidoferrales bacterium]
MPGKKNGNQSEETAQPPLSSAQKDLVREQLARILASPPFSHSKRFPEFLRYTVNRALEEDTDGVKERTIGVEVFGREANYDTSLDPVVRMTAVEVRKRLTHYYQLPNREQEPRIEFERGSYVPEFRFPPQEQLPEASQQPTPQTVARRPRITRSWWLVAACVIVPALLISGLLLGSTRKSAIDLFWSPVISSNSPVLICIPDMDSSFSSINPQQPPLDSITQQLSALPVAFRRDKVSFGDSMAVASVAGLLGANSKEFWVRHTEDMRLDDLREGPVVLIGAFSNQWAMELGNSLRYSFVRDGADFYIRDAMNPSARLWTEKGGANPEPVDYALISRVLDATTGRIVITAAGIRQYGTQAAGECITDASCFEQAEKLAQGDWAKANIQIVIATTVIGENPGKARVLAARAW